MGAAEPGTPSQELDFYPNRKAFSLLSSSAVGSLGAPRHTNQRPEPCYTWRHQGGLGLGACSGGDTSYLSRRLRNDFVRAGTDGVGLPKSLW
jgi:hypothetical protein